MIPRPPPVVPERVLYYNLDEVRKACTRPGWSVLMSSPTALILGMYDAQQGKVTKKVTVNKELTASASFEEVPIREIWNLEQMAINKLLELLDNKAKCIGVARTENPDQVKQHSTSDAYTFFTTELWPGGAVTSVATTRSKTCAGAVIEGICASCQVVKDKEAIRSSNVLKPVHPKTPLSTLSREHLIQEVKNSRQIAKRLSRMKDEIVEEGVHLSESLTKGLFADMKFGDNELMKLFWEEQIKAANRDKRGMRWHPMIIRFGIYLHYQSPRCYESLRNSGVLQLPNKSTLRDYSNIIQPKDGFCSEVLQDLQNQAQHLRPEQRFVALLHDEMKVKADIVYDRRSGEVIGFTNPDTWTFSGDEVENIATYVLVFMIVGISSHLKMSVAHFPTKTATAAEMFPLFWKTIAYLELCCGLKVITSTSDKASHNQRLYRLHKVGSEPVVYKAINPYSREKRYVYFVSDAPHLMKTIRNNIQKSQSGGTRYLWNNGKHIFWSHVYRVFSDDINRELYRTKLTSDHVNLTPSSTMSVRLAVQVLSRTVAVVMQTYYSPDMDETAHFFLLCDRFFDCLNVRSTREHTMKRKPDLAPYRTTDDERFQFLKGDFLGYLEKWHQSVKDREGFTKTEKRKMFLSEQTYEGIVMTVHAFVEATQYLLQQGVGYVLSADLCQDPLEEHFGRHRGLARRSDNPNLQQFRYQENQLRLQRGLAFLFDPKGNTSGKHGSQNRRPIAISNSPLKKRRY